MDDVEIERIEKLHRLPDFEHGSIKQISFARSVRAAHVRFIVETSESWLRGKDADMIEFASRAVDDAIAKSCVELNAARWLVRRHGLNGYREFYQALRRAQAVASSSAS